MNISLNWLTDYVDVSMPVKELAELLTSIGLGCEEIIETPTDIILDLEVTSNRPDWLGHLGVAREIAAVTGVEFRPPTFGDLPTAGRVADLAAVEVRDPDLCPRYTARVIRGVKVGPSPDWLVERLEATGLRGINNVVDVTNYVLMEYSQPLHSFDYDKLAGHKIIVRRGLPGEILTSIDETKCQLDESMLAIADGEKAVAIAGVMGGLSTEVTGQTTNVLIEAAQFDPLTTRRTSRKLALMSESNYRFERGVDPVAVGTASLRAAQMIIELAGGQLAEGILDVWAEPPEPRTVALRPQRCNALLGMEIAAERQQEILAGLGLSPRSEDGRIICTVPSHRLDIQREPDLIEEVARLAGYDKVPVTGRVTHAVTDEGQDQRVRRRVGSLLTAAGFDEAITFGFTDAEQSALFGHDAVVRVDATVRKTNNVLRPTLFPSLLRACKINQDAGNMDVSLFELAGVFPASAGGGPLPDERVELALATTRDLQELRGAIEVLAARLAPAAALSMLEADVAGLGQGAAARIELDGQTVGAIGRICPRVQSFYGLERNIALASVRFAALMEHSGHRLSYTPVPRFPAVERDLSLIVDEAVTWRQLQQAVDAVDQPMRVGLEYVTTYRGRQVPAGRKSVTVRLVYRSQTGTLRGEQVDERIDCIVAAMRDTFSAELRQ